jgi:multiple sugar transport system ATP-binding protein
MASVKLKNVYKIYKNDGGDLNAVTDFNLEIKDREVIALLGPSGCGKTSTLRMIAGLEEISKGELYIGDKLVNDVHPKDRGISMVFQTFALFPHMTAFENIAFGLQPTCMRENEIKEKVEDTARILDVFHVLDRKPAQLSGGQKQRVALARAMVRKSEVVCLDEPLSNLDAKLRAFMRTELLRLHQKFETTFIYVTHDQNEAMAIADRIVVMRDGFIKQTGTPEELYAHPDNMFVAGFLGFPQMNFLDVKIIEKNGDIFIVWDENKIKLPEDKADKACAYIDKEVIAGIRPMNLHEDGFNLKKFDKSVIEAKVDVREFLGDTVYLHCADNTQTFTVRVPPDCAAKSGDKIKISVNPEKIYLFDKDTEAAIVN